MHRLVAAPEEAALVTAPAIRPLLRPRGAADLPGHEVRLR